MRERIDHKAQARKSLYLDVSGRDRGLAVTAFTAKEEPAEYRNKVECAEFMTACHTHRMTLYNGPAFRDPVDNYIHKASYDRAEHSGENYIKNVDNQIKIHNITP